jgi:hypothetical protein
MRSFRGMSSVNIFIFSSVQPPEGGAWRGGVNFNAAPLGPQVILIVDQSHTGSGQLEPYHTMSIGPLLLAKLIIYLSKDNWPAKVETVLLTRGKNFNFLMPGETEHRSENKIVMTL